MKTMYGGNAVGKNGVHILTMVEFKIWLMTFDQDKDGRISKQELQQAVRAMRGGRFTALRGWCGVRSADANHNGYIDYDEIEKLVEFAYKTLGLIVVGS
ncbi:putative EF-hand domain-containing protein [Helianthus anomalus]